MIFEPFQLILGTGDITGMTVPAILNPNNEHLDESEGFIICCVALMRNATYYKTYYKRMRVAQN